MTGKMRHHWYKPSFWRWWWSQRMHETKGVLFALLLIGLGVAGYLSARQMTDEEPVLFTEQSITVTRTVIVKGKPRVITEVRTRTLPVETEMVTVRRNGKTVTIPAETVTRTATVKGPVRKSVVTRYKTKLKNRTIVETTTVARERLRTITLPGTTLPGTTVPGPERVVTLPERVVTGPVETVTREVTQTVTGPTQTVTGPTHTVTQTETVTGPTQTVTHTVTETETVTVTVPPTP